MNTLKEKISVAIWMAYKKMQLSRSYLRKDPLGTMKKKYCILKIDGRVHHGGLCDRLKSAVTLYALCKANNIQFKMYFSSPFELKSILKPNEYDWTISEEELTKSKEDTRLITSYKANIVCDFKNKKQIHVYNFGGGYLDDVNHKYKTEYKYSTLFSELFRPSELLSKQIQKMNLIIGGEYISVCYRFQSLLGDFYEGEHFKNISHSFDNSDRARLIKMSINALFTIQNIHPNIPLLVTSDSATFLSTISHIPNIITIPGKPVHMDFTLNAEMIVYTKSYLDLFMLSAGKKIYRVSGKGLYESGFPKVAALIGNKEIEFIKL
jgi:hypothetical protein